MVKFYSSRQAWRLAAGLTEPALFSQWSQSLQSTLGTEVGNQGPTVIPVRAGSLLSCIVPTPSPAHRSFHIHTRSKSHYFARPKLEGSPVRSSGGDRAWGRGQGQRWVESREFHTLGWSKDDGICSLFFIWARLSGCFKWPVLCKMSLE